SRNAVCSTDSSAGSRLPPGNANSPPCTPASLRRTRTTCSSPSAERYTGTRIAASRFTAPFRLSGSALTECSVLEPPHFHQVRHDVERRIRIALLVHARCRRGIIDDFERDLLADAFFSE